MSLPLCRASCSRVASILVCGLTLTPLAACYRGSSALPAPSRAERANSVLPERVPGVEVIRTPRGGVVIHVLSGLVDYRQQQLYVVDGTPALVDPRQGLDWLAPEQIARIEVLTDPAQVAIYGPRGGNGVILITTKRS